MAIPFNAAASAYANAAKLMGQSTKGVTAPAMGPEDGQDFAKMLGQAVQGVLDSGKATDTATTNMLNGKDDMVNVVTALSQTELAMDTMVTVRDRVISAYEENHADADLTGLATRYAPPPPSGDNQRGK